MFGVGEAYSDWLVNKENVCIRVPRFRVVFGSSFVQHPARALKTTMTYVRLVRVASTLERDLPNSMKAPSEEEQPGPNTRIRL